jgi:hypothetical protein
MYLITEQNEKEIIKKVFQTKKYYFEDLGLTLIGGSFILLILYLIFRSKNTVDYKHVEQAYSNPQNFQEVKNSTKEFEKEIPKLNIPDEKKEEIKKDVTAIDKLDEAIKKNIVEKETIIKDILKFLENSTTYDNEPELATDKIERILNLLLQGYIGEDIESHFVFLKNQEMYFNKELKDIYSSSINTLNRKIKNQEILIKEIKELFAKMNLSLPENAKFKSMYDAHFGQKAYSKVQDVFKKIEAKEIYYLKVNLTENNSVKLTFNIKDYEIIDPKDSNFAFDKKSQSISYYPDGDWGYDKIEVSEQDFFNILETKKITFNSKTKYNDEYNEIPEESSIIDNSFNKKITETSSLSLDIEEEEEEENSNEINDDSASNGNENTFSSTDDLDASQTIQQELKKIEDQSKKQIDLKTDKQTLLNNITFLTQKIAGLNSRNIKPYVISLDSNDTKKAKDFTRYFITFFKELLKKAIELQKIKKSIENDGLNNLEKYVKEFNLIQKYFDNSFQEYHNEINKIDDKKFKIIYKISSNPLMIKLAEELRKSTKTLDVKAKIDFNIIKIIEYNSKDFNCILRFNPTKPNQGKFSILSNQTSNIFDPSIDVADIMFENEENNYKNVIYFGEYYLNKYNSIFIRKISFNKDLINKDEKEEPKKFIVALFDEDVKEIKKDFNKFIEFFKNNFLKKYFEIKYSNGSPTMKSTELGKKINLDNFINSDKLFYFKPTSPQESIKLGFPVKDSLSIFNIREGSFLENKGDWQKYLEYNESELYGFIEIIREISSVEPKIKKIIEESDYPKIILIDDEINNLVKSKSTLKDMNFVDKINKSAEKTQTQIKTQTTSEVKEEETLVDYDKKHVGFLVSRKNDQKNADEIIIGDYKDLLKEENRKNQNLYFYIKLESYPSDFFYTIVNDNFIYILKHLHLKHNFKVVNTTHYLADEVKKQISIMYNGLKLKLTDENKKIDPKNLPVFGVIKSEIDKNNVVNFNKDLSKTPDPSLTLIPESFFFNESFEKDWIKNYFSK